MTSVRFGEKNIILPDVGYDAFIEFLYHTPSQPVLLEMKNEDIVTAYKSSRNIFGDDKDWYTNYTALKAYHATHGHCSVPLGKENRSLRSWTERQKNLHASSQLDSFKADKMKRLNFDFTVTGPLSACAPTISNVSPKNADPAVAAPIPSSRRRSLIPAWVKRRPSQMKIKSVTFKMPTPSQPKAPIVLQATTESQGFGGLILEADRTWNARFEELKAFQAKHGHCEVPSGNETMSLRSWTERQKMMKKFSKLDKDKASRMMELGYKF